MTRHSFDPVSLVAGLVFAAVAAVYLLEAHTAVNIDGRWVLPLALIGLGIGGVLGALGTAARQRREVEAVNASDVDEPAAQ